MEKQLAPRLEAALLTALAALLSLSLFADPPGSKRMQEVLVTGWLIVDDGTVADVDLVVEIDGERCHVARVLGTGRFDVALPVGGKAVLRFHKPGHLTKEVVVDTRNLDGPGQFHYVPRKVKFGVVLEPNPEQHQVSASYNGPVGSIDFLRGTGLMKVLHHENKVTNFSSVEF